MRLSFVFPLLLASGVFASDHYPYSATIGPVTVEVRSGPDADYYPTSLLHSGDRVEVYYETDDWCAIRPPMGSFSWISARYVDLGTNNIGSVAADGLAARVGSELKADGDELCETVQVKLKRGENVLVLGRLETPENPASPLWLKIAPPSGEFRWIPRTALARTPSAANGKQRAIVQVVYAEETDTPPILPAPILPAPAKPIKPVKPVESVRIPEEKLPTSPSPDPEPELPPLAEKLALSRPDRIMTTAPAVTQETPTPFQKAFAELQTETRIVLTRPTDDWVFETLIHRGNELYEIAPTEQDLEKIYHLVETLQRTRAVRQEITMRRQFRTSPLLTPPPSALPTAATTSGRYASNVTTATSNRTSSVVPASLPRTATVSTPAARTTGLSAGARASFDVSGKLGEFEPLPKGHPPYAVVDEKEQIVCLITPATGVELKQHVGKVVGVNGILGVYERPGKPNSRHITAQTVGVISE